MDRGFLAVGVLLVFGAPAFSAECMPPELPAAALKPMKPRLPDKPSCLDARGGCPGWEAYSYNDTIKTYNARIEAYRPLAEAYVKALNAYVKGSADYAQCEVKTLQ